jgi:hypothetical protein
LSTLNTLHVNDFIALGRTVPEESKKYGKRVCMAGFSPQCNQLLRVYPLMLPIGANAGTNSFKARHTYSVDLQRNTDDNRSESWRVADELNPTSTPWGIAEEVKKPALIDMLVKRAVPSIKCLNVCRLSLGVMYLKAGEWQGISIPKKEKVPEPEHASLFDDLAEQAAVPDGQRIDPTDVKFAPYIKFEDPDGKHKLQVREWGAFLLMGNPKYANDPDALWNANGYKRDRDTVVVLGNMAKHRNNWLIIKLFQVDKGSELGALFDTSAEEPKDAPAPKAKKKL